MNWWNESEEQLHTKVINAFESIEKRQENRRKKNASFMGFYENRDDITSLDGADWAQSNSFRLDKKSVFAENVYKAAVDTAVAKISTVRPRLIQLTNGAEYELQAKARKRTLMVEGVIHDQKGYKKGRQIFRDACIFDNGLIAVYPDYARKKITLERVLDAEISVDYLDGKYGCPRSMFRHKIISRSELFAMYPGKEYKYAIENSGLMRGGNKPESIDDPVSALEAFHLPSGPKAKDGLHLICVEKGILYKGNWERERFPFAGFRWKDRSLGWHGMGIVEDIQPLHKQLSALDQKIESLLDSATVRVGIEAGSKVNREDLTNEYDGFPIYEYTGRQPLFNHDPGPPPELFMERERIKRAIFEHLGLSQLFAESKKPPGLTAGVAIREAKDVESARFTDVYQAWDEFWVEVGELILDALEDLVEHVDPKDILIEVPTGGSVESIVISDIDMDRKKYKLQIRPASLLPKEPPGRIAKITEMAQQIPAASALLYSKIDSPDVDDITSLLSANGDAIRYDIEKLSEGEFIQPEPFIDIDLAQMFVLSAYNKARNHNAKEQILDAFRNYLVSLNNMKKEIMEQQIAAMGPGMPPPAAMPQLPPEALPVGMPQGV